MLASSSGYGYATYGTLRESDSSPVPQEPLSLEEAKAFLRVDFPDDDNVIAGLITGARKQAEVSQRRTLVPTQFDLFFDYFPSQHISLSSPVVSVDLVQYKTDAGTLVTLSEGTHYIVDLHKEPAVLMPPWNCSWPWFMPWPSSAVLVRFTAGYAPDAPFWSGRGATLKTGMLLLIAAWYTNRLPFALGVQAIAEYPYAITSLLNDGNLRRPR